jgi:expansin (peptidoglycan-binding protein)
MVRLEYFNGTEWILIDVYHNEHIAWVTLGGDDYNYRTVSMRGQVLTDKSKFNKK